MTTDKPEVPDDQLVPQDELDGLLVDQTVGSVSEPYGDDSIQDPEAVSDDDEAGTS